jgi:alpha-beta hydrolase superfamily lysophospholipase
MTSTTSGQTQSPDTILLIHGLWMTPLSWEHWVKYYSDKGYRVIASGWPGLDGDIEELRRDPSPIATLGVTDIVVHYDSIIRGLDRPPIIMGHSFGGLMTQILLDRGLGAAGVAIASAPAKGVIFLPFSTLKVAFPALSNPANNDFHNDTRAPLLMIAGGLDHISPPAVVHANFKLYHHSKAVTEYREFPERTHYTLGQDGWQQVADFALDWSVKHAAAAAPARAAAGV